MCACARLYIYIYAYVFVRVCFFSAVNSFLCFFRHFAFPLSREHDEIPIARLRFWRYFAFPCLRKHDDNGRYPTVRLGGYSIDSTACGSVTSRFRFWHPWVMRQHANHCAIPTVDTNPGTIALWAQYANGTDRQDTQIHRHTDTPTDKTHRQTNTNTQKHKHTNKQTH